MNNLVDIRRDESQLNNQLMMLVAFIILTIATTFFSYSIVLSPRYANQTNLKIKWLIFGLINNFGTVALTQKLNKIEKRLEQIEQDCLTFEENNRITLLATGNEKFHSDLTNQLNPPKEEKDPFLEAMMAQLMNAPIKGESDKKEAIKESIPTQSTIPVYSQPVQNYQVETNYSQPISGQSEVEFLIPQKQELKATGASILDEASATSLSTIFVSPPGTGKTVTLLDWKRRLFVKFPDTYVTVVAQKNDSFLGLNAIGAVSVFNGIDLTIVENAINELFDILNMRKSCDEITRQQFKTQPCWLILDDWFSIYEVVSKNKKLWSDLSAKLSTIVTVGREFNVAIAVTTHSFNIASLGLAKDSNIRSCLNIMSLGFISKDEYGRNQGGFDAINGILNNNSIISMEYREPLKQELERLIVDSNNNQTPVIFTTMGHPPRMALLPNLINIKTYKIPHHILQSLQNKISKIRGKSLQIETIEKEDDDSIYNEIEIQDKKNQVYELIEKGITSKMDIIKQVWGASTGRKYQQACQEYNQIMEG